MIPTYNQSQYLAQAIESALAQTYPHLEVVVCDDASTDSTPDVLKQFQDRRLKYHRNPKNIGRTANYKRLLYEHSTGDYVVNLDGDDYYTDTDFIDGAVAEIRQHDDVVIVSARAYTVTNSGRSLSPTPGHKVIKGVDVVRQLPNAEHSFMHMSALYRRDKAMAIDFYRSEMNSTDWESLYRLCLFGSVVYIDKPVGVWRIHGENQTGTLEAGKHLANLSIWPPIFTAATQLGMSPLSAQVRRAKCIASFSEASIMRTSLKGNQETLAFVFGLLREHTLGGIFALLYPRTFAILALSLAGHYRRKEFRRKHKA